MATLQERITALAQAVGADIKALQAGGGGGGGGGDGCVGGPNTPTLVSPAPGANGSRKFTVGAYSHPSNFAKWCTQIQRASDAAFTTDVESSPIDTANAGTSLNVTGGIREGINYWRARDIDVFGNASAWSAGREYMAEAPATSVAGGAVADDGDYAVHTFTSSGTLTITDGDITADVLIVGGGGAGGLGVGGGGGAGAVYYSQTVLLTEGTYAVTVGAGSAPGGTGGSSSIAGLASATGGASGTSAANAGVNGGTKATAATGGGAGDGGNGSGKAAGGGGGGAAGSPAGGGGAGVGGAGFACAISPARTHYAGGGGGGAMTGYGAAASGGTGGGGAGAGGDSVPGTAGTPNTGSGGGGGGYSAGGSAGGAGGSGVVIVRYLKE